MVFQHFLSFCVHVSDQIGRVKDHFFGFVTALIVAVFGSWFMDVAARVLFAFFPFCKDMVIELFLSVVDLSLLNVRLITA